MIFSSERLARGLTTPPALLLAAWILWSASRAGAQPAAEPPRSPDIVFIIASDFNASTIGAYGSTIGRTPNIDRLAASGALFTRAYCNAPVGPVSRQSLLTGKTPHDIRATLFHSSLSYHEITLPMALAKSGYSSFVAGRMRFNVNSSYGFAQMEEEDERDRYLERKNFTPLEAGGPFHPLDWNPFQGSAAVWLNAANLPIPAHTNEVSERFFAERAATVLKKESTVPTLVFAGVRQPSTPFSYPVEFRGAFDPAQIAPPELAPGEEAAVPEAFAALTPAERAGILAGYYTTMTFVDECVGVVLDAVEESGRAGNTVVIFLSDAGYMLGEHGWFEKNCFYEPAVRVPLIIRWPGRVQPGTVINDLVELIDVFPTVLEIAGLSMQLAPEARSLVPVLSGFRGDPRDHVFSEYLENEEAMIRDTRYKLIYSSGRANRSDGLAPASRPPGRGARLYDMVNDPGEFVNLANDPTQQARVERMKRQLLARLTADRDGFDSYPANLTLEDRLDLMLIPPENWFDIEIEYRRMMDSR